MWSTKTGLKYLWKYCVVFLVFFYPNSLPSYRVLHLSAATYWHTLDTSDRINVRNITVFPFWTFGIKQIKIYIFVLLKNTGFNRLYVIGKNKRVTGRYYEHLIKYNLPKLNNKHIFRWQICRKRKANQKKKKEQNAWFKSIKNKHISWPFVSFVSFFFHPLVIIII